MRRLLLSFTLLVFTGCAQFGKDNPTALLIANARIITGTGAVLESGSLLVYEGKILLVSEDADEVLRQYLALPAVQENKGKEIDGGGMTMMPGLIDTHRHVPT